MKHIKTLLGLVLMVFVLAGCSSPVGPEFSEIDKTTVVETPEDNIKSVKVEFRWGTSPIRQYNQKGETISSTIDFRLRIPMYLLSLHCDSKDNYSYGFSGDELVSYKNLIKDEKAFNEFYNDTFEKVFGTKYSKEGEEINLTEWTSGATYLLDTSFTDCLQFSLKDIDGTEKPDDKDLFDQIIVGNEDIVVYVFFCSEYSTSYYGLR